MTDQNWYLGHIKFFDNSKGFGFVKSEINRQDYYVNITNVKTLPLQDYDKVVFKLNPSRRKTGTLEATSLYLLSSFDLDTEFLKNQYFSLIDPIYKKAVLKVLPANTVNSIVQQELAKINVVSNQEEYKSFIEKVASIKKSFQDALPQSIISELIAKHAIQAVSPSFIVQLWLNDVIQTEPDLATLREYFKDIDKAKRETFYKKISTENRLKLFKTYLDAKYCSGSFHNLLYFLQLENQLELQSQFIIAFNNLQELETLSLDESTKYSQRLLDIIPRLDKNTSWQLISSFYRIAADYIKLELWLSDLVSKEDYSVYHSNFIFLPTTKQIRYIKKLFYLLSIKTPGIYYENIIALRNLTYSFSEGKKFQLDFSCNIILSSIESIKNGIFLSEEAIFSLLTKQVEHDTASLLSLEGFFEKCTGRTIPDNTEEDEQGNKRIISLKSVSSARDVEFCEGVRFGGDGKDRKFNHECWWCRGGSCYDANQSMILPKHYSDYTLANFLTILNIPFDLKSYFDFLGLLNKINIFLKHLNCRSCNHILKPNKEGYYSYYRVSNFICSNPNCDNKQSVYLNHCLAQRARVLNNRCFNLIDSRDTVRCNYVKHNPRDNYEKYGPYICNHCGSCCSQQSLSKKCEEYKYKNWKMQPGLEWKVRNNVGHLERNELFCYKCGSEMVDYKKEYDEFLQKLEHPDNTFKVLKKGSNAYGFWYLIKAEAAFFEKASQIGFRVTDTRDNDPNVKFVAQGNTNFLICQSCNTKYDRLKGEFIVEGKNNK